MLNEKSLKKQKKFKKYRIALMLIISALLSGCANREQPINIENLYIFPYPSEQVADEFERVCGNGECPYTVEWYGRLIKLSEIMELNEDERTGTDVF